jgi:hypothetical protein
VGWGATDSVDWLVSSSFIVDHAQARQLATVGTTNGSLPISLEQYEGPVFRAEELISHPRTVSDANFWRDWQGKLGIKSTKSAASTSFEHRPVPHPVVRFDGGGSPVADVADALHALCELTFDSEDVAADVAEYLLSGVPLPQFGSPPQALTTIGNLARDSGPAASVLLLSEDITHPSPGIMIAALATQVVWVNFAKPTLAVTSAAWESWLKKRFKQ